VLRFLIVVLVLLAAGCAGIAGPGSPFGDITKLTATDIQAALADATAHQDLAAMQCYPVLLDVLGSLQTQGQPAPTIAGVVSAFQAARDLSKAVQSGATSGQNAIVQKVNLGCAALFNDAHGDVLRLAVLFRP
jgi:hypothetical protein